MNYKQKFLKVFNGFSAKHRRETVFSDFVMVSAASFHNAVCFSQHLEDRYFEIIKKYSKEEMLLHCELLACVVEGLEAAMGDFLGDVFMELELGDARAGHFFPPIVRNLCIAATTSASEL